jgi:uncharacterized membrane protein
MRKYLIFLFIIISLPYAQGATIKGTAYDWFSMEPLGGVVIEVNSTPPQQVVARDGSYSLELPVGSYQITARYYRYGVLEYYAEENISVVGDGVFILDLIMLPALEEERLLPPELLELEELADNQRGRRDAYLLAAVLLVSISFLIFMAKRWRGERRERIRVGGGLPEDLKEVLAVIQAKGGRVTQTELRKKLPYSEAKISLMLSDLESRGIIRKIKKGRGNIIILVEPAKE